MDRRAVFVLWIALAACPRGHDKTIEPAQKKDGGSRLLPGDGEAGSGVAELPPAPPLPEVPLGLPPVQLATTVTPDAVAFGDSLFRDMRLSVSGKLACATCHDPAHGFSGGVDATAAGKPNLRRTPALVDLAWQKEFGWDGRYKSLDEQLRAHVTGQLGQSLDASAKLLEADPVIHAHVVRVGGAAPDAMLQALAAYVLTRYEGDSPWDRAERSASASADLKAGYQLFVGKARCASCHTPPLYSDLGYHRVNHGPYADKGRALVEPGRDGQFKTPTLRGAAARKKFFHAGTASPAGADSLEAVLSAYQQASSIPDKQPGDYDAALDKPLRLTEPEAQQLLAFVRALSRDAP